MFLFELGQSARLSQMLFFLIAFLLKTLCCCIEAKYIFDASPITECDNGIPFVSFDFDDFSIINADDGKLIYNGSITVLKDYKSPWKTVITSKRLERGTWQPGIVSKELSDLCSVIRNPMEPGLYKMTKKLEQGCPFKAGYVQRFNMVDVGSFGMVIPPSFSGDWKFYVEMWPIRNGKMEHECYLFPATVYEA